MVSWYYFFLLLTCTTNYKHPLQSHPLINKSPSSLISHNEPQGWVYSAWGPSSSSTPTKRAWGWTLGLFWGNSTTTQPHKRPRLSLKSSSLLPPLHTTDPQTGSQANFSSMFSRKSPSTLASSPIPQSLVHFRPHLLPHELLQQSLALPAATSTIWLHQLHQMYLPKINNLWYLPS